MTRERRHRWGLPSTLLRAAMMIALIFTILSERAAAAETERPNFLFIFIDDLGYGDLSCYGNRDLKTENIDRLAAQGVRFTQFYVNSPICSPSRVAVTTGQYPQRWWFYGHLAARRRNRARGMVDFLDPAAVTLPRLLHDAGYATGHFGKWHMGGGRDVDDAPLPQAYGFDESLVSFEGLGDRLLDEDHALSDASAKLGRGRIRFVPKHAKTRLFVDQAIDFIRRHQDRPFYVNFWPNDVHDPFHPSEQQLEGFGRFADRPEWQKFYAVLQSLDHEIGRLVDAIDEMGLGEKTMIILTGDNGPTAWSRYYRDGKGAGAAPGSTGGLRGRKWSLYEGGIRQPLIVRWTGQIPVGQVNESTVAAGVDLLPSVCAIAGVPLPADYEPDGVDVSSSLLGRSEPIRDRPLYWEYNSLGGNIQPGLQVDRSPTLALRDGNWKFLINADGSGAELYYLAHDREESKNLADKEPDRADRMKRALLTWYQALPAPKGGLVRPQAVANDRPNFLFVMADDCTYWDMECYGGQAKTPHLNRLCQEGMKFTRCFQAAPMCSPTRHCLYTGLYPVKSGAYPNHTFVEPGTKSIAHDLKAAGYRVALSGKRHINPPEAFPFEYSNKRNNPNLEAIDAFLGECRSADTPFCLFACSNEPHEPWNRGDASAYPPESLTLPPFFVDTPETRERYARYLAEITYFDAQVGQCLELLEKHGLRENTLVIVATEQGNSFAFAKWTCYDMGLASGLIVRWPGRVQAGRTTDAMVEYVDVVPTFLEAAGAAVRDNLDGRSFLPVLLGKTGRHKQHVFGLQTSRGIINGPDHYGIRSVRSERYLYIRNLDETASFRNAVMRSAWWKSWIAKAESGDEHARTLVDRYQHRPAEELYDVLQDRYNQRNLANDPALAQVKQDLRRRLDAWMHSQGDRGQATERAAHARQWRKFQRRQKERRKR